MIIAYILLAAIVIFEAWHGVKKYKDLRVKRAEADRIIMTFDEAIDKKTKVITTINRQKNNITSELNIYKKYVKILEKVLQQLADGAEYVNKDLVMDILRKEKENEANNFLSDVVPLNVDEIFEQIAKIKGISNKDINFSSLIDLYKKPLKGASFNMTVLEEEAEINDEDFLRNMKVEDETNKLKCFGSTVCGQEGA